MAGDTTSTTVLPLKIIAGADDFGASLKDAMVSHLRSLGIHVEDTGVSSYYSAGSEVGRRVSASSSSEVRGLVCCGTGVGVAMFANKFPGVYAATCLSVEDAVNARSISKLQRPRIIRHEDLNKNCRGNLRRLDQNSVQISSFLDNSLSEMAHIGISTVGNSTTKKIDETTAACAICCLAKNREFTPVDIMPGGSMKIMRETPTSAIVRFKAASVEPAHHHTFGHDLVVIKGKKTVWNLSKKERVDLVDGDYLFTPAGDVHRVKYHEDTEFFITWDGHWDIFLDEDLETAKKTIEEEASM
ncbi:hypothetical protein CARUB_v10015551mg [Capsella rubella]|uniref:ChrR-like cupin domain-containing protein n=1 Tax=Capsella rubella TaxID=81985 RepID=R0HR75_9BRAS|nr:hypothetical protein CARUB_v10015551mg [Capsella rubella]